MRLSTQKVILTLPTIAGEAWEFHDCSFTTEALLGNLFSHLYFSPLLSDCAQVCWHLQPVPAVGPEQTVERASLWGVLPARSAPSPPALRHGVQPDRELTLARSIQPFALKYPSRTGSCTDTLPHLEREEEQRSSEDLRDPAALLAGGRQSCAVPQLLNFAEEPTAWFLAENPPAVVSSSELKLRQGYPAPASCRYQLHFISLFRLSQLLQEAQPPCFPNMTHSSA